MPGTADLQWATAVALQYSAAGEYPCYFFRAKTTVLAMQLVGFPTNLDQMHLAGVIVAALIGLTFPIALATGLVAANADKLGIESD